MAHKLILLLTLLMSLSRVVFGQDEQLAQQYYNDGEFDKAVILYEKLFAKNTSNPVFYENYLQSLIQLKRFDDALKVTKKQSKKYDEVIAFAVDYGMVLESSGNKAKADVHFKKLIADLKSNSQDYAMLAAAFTRRNYYDLAVETYQRARRISRDETLFGVELAQVYNLQNNKDGVVNEYLNLLENNEQLLSYIQNSLQSMLTQSKDAEMLKAALLRRSQKNPDKTVFNEMLIWIFSQQKNWEAAFIQAKALDKRLGEDGRRCLDLANLCISNNAYDAAYAIYQYVSSLGKNGYYYLESRIGLLDVASKRTFFKPNYTRDDLNKLKADYEIFLTEFGRNAGTASVMRNLSELFAFHLDEKEKAIALLEEIIQLPQIKPAHSAECKLTLGDIYVLKAEYWEAMLVYGQVDKDFKDEPLGQEAKFRNAKLSYYKGEFEWAQAQLDVLKTATSQLISNNAIELSLLIQENTGLDSILTPMQWYADADLLIYQNKFAQANAKLDSITANFPEHSLADEILYLKAQIMRKQQRWTEAISFLEEVLKKAPDDLMADNSLFELAEIQERILNNPEKAKQLYEDLFTKYPGSLLSVEARKRYRILRGDKVANDEL